MVISANCDDSMTLFVNGQVVAYQTYALRKQTKTVTVFVKRPSVVGVYCVNSNGNGGILVSASTNIVTDSSWRCKSNNKQHEWNLVRNANILHTIHEYIWQACLYSQVCYSPSRVLMIAPGLKPMSLDLIMQRVTLGRGPMYLPRPPGYGLVR